MELAWQRLLRLLRDGEGTGTGEGTGKKPNGSAHDDDDDDDDEPDDPDAARRLKDWQTYAKRLRTKEANKRVENKQLKSEIETLKADKKKMEADHAKALEKVANDEKVKYEALVADSKKQSDAQRVDTELRAQATKAGAKDVDDLLKLIDKSTTTIDDKGNVVGADKAIEEFKKTKPHLFGVASSSSSKAETPPATDPGTAKKASDMTKEEYEAARSKFTGTPYGRR